jgi:dienelactone hydrolase
MKVIKHVLVRLPEKVQDGLMDYLMKRGSIFKTPVWEMLFRTLDFMGVDIAAVRAGFGRMKTESLDATTACRLMGHKMRRAAQQAELAGDLAQAKDAYFQAGSMYLLADFFLYRPTEEETNYLLAMPCFDRYRQMCTPPIQKHAFPYQGGNLQVYYHLPVGEGPFPAIVFTQGNDEIKEAMTKWAEYATRRGMVVFNGDPPGWGESGLSGTRFRSQADLRAYARIAVDFLQSRPEVDGDKIGIFGISYGGLTSLYCAGLEPRIVAAGGLGGPFLDVNQNRREALAAQRRKSHKISGAKSDEEHSQIMDSLDSEAVLAQVKCPALVIHGADDLLVNGIESNRQLAEAISGPVTARVMEGGDHMCSQFLKEGLVDEIFDWFSEQLGGGG